MHNDGRNYESFVAGLQQALIDSEGITSQKNILIQLNKKITDNCGIYREFDLYWEYEFAGITYKTVIECKDYNSSVSVEKIDSLIGKIRDIPDLKAVFATKKGYQKGAKAKASQNKIDLLVVRKQNDSDWVDTDGTPFIKTININLVANLPAEILKFVPCVDGKWVKENTNIEMDKPLQIYGLNSDIFIEDLDNGNKFSLLELGSILKAKRNNDFGIFSEEEHFNNAYIYYDNYKLKLKSYKIEYVLTKPLEQPIQIDFSKELIGVIEYLDKNYKKAIFKSGVVKENELISK